MVAPVWISHLGHSHPGPSLDQGDLTGWMATRLAPGSDPQRFARFAQRCGVDRRHSVLDLRGGEADALYPPDGRRPGHDRVSELFAQRAAPLAAEAVRRACDGEAPAGISHLVTATCTGAVTPGFDVQLVQRLGLGQGVRRTMIGFMGCYAAIPALRLARDICRAEPAARVLVVCCELCSLHLELGPADDALIAACLFGDGAAAAVVEAGPEPLGAGIALGADCSLLAGDGDESMAWRAGPHGFSISLSPYLARAIAQDLEPLVAALAPDGASSRDWFVHPGGPRIIDAVAGRLGLDEAAVAGSRRALREGGNRSSMTILAMVADAVARDWRGSAVAVAFGPGLTIDAIGLERW